MNCGAAAFRRCRLGWGEVSFVELLLYTMHHVQGHAAKLNLFLAEAWSREAKVTGAGKPLIRSVYTYAGSLAVHERPHLKQIQRIVNTIREQTIC